MEICNEYDVINFESGILDNIIDAVYVITLKKSPRIENVYKQINEFKLSKNNIIQINERYTDCNVDLCKQKPNYHLLNNLVNICKHSNNKKYNNILILEDDFIFDDQIKDKQIIKDLDDFINNNNFNLYNLGGIFISYIPYYSLKHFKYYLGLTSHSIIYSKNARDIIIEKYENDKCMKNTILNYPYHDWWFNTNMNNKFFYYKPLCYQPVENTENQKTWNNSISGNIICNIIKLYGLDITPNLGFKRIYITSYILNIIIFMVFIIIILNFKKHYI